MRKKIIVLSSIGMIALSAFAVHTTTTVVDAEESVQSVYVSNNGLDTNLGTESAPFQTVEKALEQVPNGGTIVLQNTVAMNEWKVHGKTVSITGENLSMTWSNNIVINDNVHFYDITLSVQSTTNLFANGNSVTIGENVEWSDNPTIELHGGGMEGTTVASTDLTVLSGTYKSIFGGSQKGTVLGDTNLFVGGTVNSTVNTTNHGQDCFVFGGGNEDTIKGSTHVTFGGNAKVVYLFGGSNKSATIGGASNISVIGGKGMSIYGGNRSGDSGADVNFKMTGGEFEQIFGGNERASMTGDVDMRVLGGTVTRRVYGGCYNDTTGSSFSTSYSVNGKICLTIGNAIIDFSVSDPDRSIYARSRYSDDIEETQLVFANKTAYNSYKNKLGAQDAVMKPIMGSLSVADETHCYAYELQGNVITQTCLYHDTLSATATISMEEGLVEMYSGAAIEPATVETSGDWEYDEPNVSYQNNVEIGTATCRITIGDIAIEKEFLIIDTPTILGGSVRLSEPAGLRFQSKVPEGMLEMGATFGTLVIPRAVLGESELTMSTPKVKHIPQTKWATEVVKQSYSVDYEEGYEYFNAVLTDIPEANLGTEIVARSYVCVDGVYYYSQEVERSVAQVAAFALQAGYTDEVLKTYVDTALAGETKGLEREVIIGETCEYQLTLSGTKGYVAIWKVENEHVVQVGKNGKIQAVSEGETWITATIGTTVLQCKVIVRKDVLDNSNELPLIPYE